MNAKLKIIRRIDKNKRCEGKAGRKIIPRDRQKHKRTPKSGSIILINPSLQSSLSKMTLAFPSKSGLVNIQSVMAYICSAENKLSVRFSGAFKEF